MLRMYLVGVGEGGTNEQFSHINNFLSNDHIWNCWNLKGHISQTRSDILLKFSGFSILIDSFQVK